MIQNVNFVDENILPDMFTYSENKIVHIRNKKV